VTAFAKHEMTKRCKFLQGLQYSEPASTGRSDAKKACNLKQNTLCAEKRGFSQT